MATANEPPKKRRPRAQPEPTWELIRKRNYVERLKHEKQPVDVLADLPTIIDEGYEETSEEDFVRFQWYGLYHDKPKVGNFMMRIKAAGGILTPEKLATIADISRTFGEGYGELTTRQNIQLHHITLASLPEIFQRLEAGGLTTTCACGDTVRNVTSCPLAGISRDELFDVRPILDEVDRYFTGNRDYMDLPRKHKITIAACPHQCNGPEFHCIALAGVLRNDRPGFAIRLGGGLSIWPRIADDLGVWIPVEDTLPVLRAILDTWKEDLQSRMSRAKARLKFMVDRVGIEPFRQLVEARLGRPMEDGSWPTPPANEHNHVGVEAQKEPGRSSVGFPAFLGHCQADQMEAIARVAKEHGAGIRLTRRQNFILTDLDERAVESVSRQIGELGFPLEGGGLRASAIACTGEPFCNFAVSETKGKMDKIVRHLESVFGSRVDGLRLNLDGCPNSCAHHWIGDIGFQGTTLRQRGPNGERLRGYDLFFRGGLGRDAAIGRPLMRRVPAAEVEGVVERILHAFFDHRQNGESLQSFFTRLPDEEIVALGIGAPPPEPSAAPSSATGPSA